MNRFVVPQFIDVEDKIFGPVTVRQFLICVFGSMLLFVAYKLADFSLFVLEALIIGGSTIVIAFVKVNGKNFHNFLLDILFFSFKTSKLSIWQKEEDFINQKEKDIIEDKDDYSYTPKSFSKRKLAEISLIIDTGGVYVGESKNQKDEEYFKIKNNTI